MLQKGYISFLLLTVSHFLLARSSAYGMLELVIDFDIFRNLAG
jgi:hypothetical protein